MPFYEPHIAAEVKKRLCTCTDLKENILASSGKRRLSVCSRDQAAQTGGISGEKDFRELTYLKIEALKASRMFTAMGLRM
jgi:hypothetical protein